MERGNPRGLQLPEAAEQIPEPAPAARDAEPVDPERILLAPAETGGRMVPVPIVYNLLRAGHTYLVPESSPGAPQSFKLLMEMMREGFQGLCFSTIHPEMLWEELGPTMKQARTCWLTRRQQTEHPTVQGLEELTLMVEKFLEADPRGIVLLDGFEYLAVQYNFTAALLLLMELRDVVASHRGRLLVPISTKAFTGTERAMLERHLEVFQHPGWSTAARRR
ncbi:MAG: DUF835 domain-containing protein [Euryarchaeota archaeon]|nr:DUF835 domain-containing protein [Euryarchaeota archaeon]